MDTNRVINDALRATANMVNPTPPKHTAARPLVQNLSLRVEWTARRDLLLAALERLVVDCYEQANGQWVNVDGVSGALLIPGPWSKHNGHKWGLRRNEREVLRAILIQEQKQGPEKGRTPLFLWSAESRRWYVDTYHYPDAASARAYVSAFAQRVPWAKVLEAATWVETHKPTGGRKGGLKGGQR